VTVRPVDVAMTRPAGVSSRIVVSGSVTGTTPVSTRTVVTPIVPSGVIGEDDLLTFADLVRGTTPARPRLITTVGMGWEDLVIAAAVVDAA
jgi:hypothetical protein